MEKDAIEERERQEEAAREKKMKEEADQRLKEDEAAGLVGKEESTADKQLEADVEEVFFNFYYWHTIISYVFQIWCFLNADCDQWFFPSIESLFFTWQSIEIYGMLL